MSVIVGGPRLVGKERHGNPFRGRLDFFSSTRGMKQLDKYAWVHVCAHRGEGGGPSWSLERPRESESHPSTP